MPPLIISDIITVGDIAILDENRWPADCNRNGTIIAIISETDDYDPKESTKWFGNEYEQHLTIKTIKIAEYLFVILPHISEYQLEGYKPQYCYSETTFYNRRCIITLPDHIKQISPTGLFSKDRISNLIMREASMLPTRINGE